VARIRGANYFFFVTVYHVAGHDGNFVNSQGGDQNGRHGLLKIKILKIYINAYIHIILSSALYNKK